MIIGGPSPLCCGFVSVLCFTGVLVALRRQTRAMNILHVFTYNMLQFVVIFKRWNYSLLLIILRVQSFDLS